jgi:oligopeptide/dipeptide ABC transporter ATP-binding protein
MSAHESPVLDVRGLRVEYRTGRHAVTAVDGVTFTVGTGESLGLVGESGSGKTTIGRAILGLVPPRQGTITLNGHDATTSSRRVRRRLAADRQVVFQDPYGSLNPALKVGISLLETLPAGTPARDARARMAEMLERVGLAVTAADEYPSRFSGGQRQRLAIARALMPLPKLVICDEPVSALDVSIQAQVLNLLRELQTDLGISYLFIGHNLDVVRFISDRMLVLYHGRVVEEGPAALLATSPRHPYTKALVAAAPRLGGTAGTAPRSDSRAPVAIRPRPQHPGPPTGCRYANRCPFALDLCRSHHPELVAVPGGGAVACHRSTELSATTQ